MREITLTLASGGMARLLDTYCREHGKMFGDKQDDAIHLATYHHPTLPGCAAGRRLCHYGHECRHLTKCNHRPVHVKEYKCGKHGKTMCRYSQCCVYINNGCPYDCNHNLVCHECSRFFPSTLYYFPTRRHAPSGMESKALLGMVNDVINKLHFPGSSISWKPTLISGLENLRSVIQEKSGWVAHNVSGREYVSCDSVLMPWASCSTRIVICIRCKS
jgi:hypothetical protein